MEDKAHHLKQFGSNKCNKLLMLKLFKIWMTFSLCYYDRKVKSNVKSKNNNEQN